MRGRVFRISLMGLILGSFPLFFMSTAQANFLPNQDISLVEESPFLGASGSSNLTPPHTTPEENTPTLPDVNVAPPPIVPNNEIDGESEFDMGDGEAAMPDNDMGSPPDPVVRPIPTAEETDRNYYIYIVTPLSEQMERDQELLT